MTQKTIQRNWKMYNLAQTSEKTLAMGLLNDAVNSLGIPYFYSGNGRPPLGMDDAIKAMVIKVFNNWSCRRSIPDIEYALRMNYIHQIPHFNIICKYMRSPEITPYLHKLYMTLATPLTGIEDIFAVDASGFSLFKKHWVDHRLDKRLWKMWKKMHIISGVHTNIITKAIITDGKAGDSPQFSPLVRATGRYFRINEVSADKAYSSRDNHETVSEFGGTPYISFRSNAGKRPWGSPMWKKMIRIWVDNREEFLEHYHKRSNVESTFSAMKRKFLPYVRSKSETGQINEMLCKVVCQNLSVLVMAVFEFGTTTKFKNID